MIKRTISFLLVLAMLAGCLPMTAWAEETENTESTVVTEESAETEATAVTEETVPAEETFAPMEAETESAEETTAPTEAVAEPSVENMPGETVGEAVSNGIVDDTVIGMGTCGDNLTWTLDDEGTLTISGTGPMWDYIGSNVGSNRAPWYDSGVIKAVIEPGVTSIGIYAFYQCKSLTSVTIPDSVTSIGHSAFGWCTGLISATIPDGVTSIEDHLFFCCMSLTSVTIPSSVTSIEFSAFAGCESLTSVTIPDGVTSIGNSAFRDCSNLTSVTIPDGVTSIESSLFESCSSLTSVTIPSRVTSIGNNAFRDCDSLTSVTIPDSVTTIGERAFLYCSGLTSVTISDSVTSIGEQAFSGCGNLTGIWVGAANPKYSSDDYGALLDKKKTTLLQLPGGFRGSYTIPDGVTSIGEEACSLSGSLTGVMIPNSVTNIGSRAFYSCDSLTSVTVPDSVSNIGGAVFMDCTSLTSVKIGSNVSSIGSNAFYMCSSLSSITIGSSVSNIGSYAFYDCTSLTNVTIPDSVISIGNSAFSGCDSLTSITIPDGVTSIGNGAFAYCSSLTSVTIPDSVTSIGEQAFSGCISLTGTWVEVTNPNYSSDDHGVLFDKNKATLIQFPGGFCGSYTIPNGVISIGEEAFSSSGSLTGVTIPNSVTNIGYRAFFYCDSLTEVHFVGDAPAIGEYCFCGVTATAYYPEKNPTWTESVMQNYFGTITWVAYDPEDAPGDNGSEDEESGDKACRLDELTDLDYLAFSKIAYENFKKDETVRECLERKGLWKKTWGVGITYGDLCSGIANWRVYQLKDLSKKNGFYAVAFENTANEVVIAYRGSDPIELKGFYDVWNLLTSKEKVDARWDWLVSDLGMVFFNDAKETQHMSAFEFYEKISKSKYWSEIAVTGHSLGGGLGNIVSARYGCKSVTTNAISMLDVIYVAMPKEMGEYFRGVDQWNFVDHANDEDNLAGVFEATFSTRIKPYIAHKTLEGLFAHSLNSYVERNSEGEVKLTKETSRFFPTKAITNNLSFTDKSIDLGTSRDDSIKKGLYMSDSRRSFGGMGDDEIYSSINGDVLIGGEGNDALDGGWNNDRYIYYKGNGRDTIYDAEGEDVIYLVKFSESDRIEVNTDENSDYISICCNGEGIIDIYKKNRMDGNFNVYVEATNAVIDITDSFRKKPHTANMGFRCPVNVEILDADGNVVYVLEDGKVGSHYTDYGNFYIYEEEDGGYGKTLDLVEGYTARVVGVDDGTMEIDYREVVDGELAEPKNFVDVPVTGDFTATFEETEDGELVLAADTDGDGTVDAKIGYDGKVIPVESVTVSQEYIVLKPQESAQLSTVVQPAELIEFIRWSVEAGGEEIISVDAGGNVTALKQGTAYVLATVTNGEYSGTARCRVDIAKTEVVEEMEKILLDGIQLSTTKAVSELNSTDYSTFEVLLKLPQNNTVMSVGKNAQIPENLGVAIESARFMDKDVAKYFNLIPQDDRTLAIVPTDYAISNPKEVKSSYKSTIGVTVEGKEYPSDILTLSVKKSQPKLKVSVPAFNSFYAGQSQDLMISGATVTSVEATAMPDWLTLDGKTLTLKENAPAKSVSGKVNLLVYTEEWRIPAEVTLNVKNTYKAATLKLSASSVTLNASAKDQVSVMLTANPADFDIDEPAFRLTDSAGIADKNGELTVGYKSGKITVGTTEKTRGNYKLFVRVGNTNEVPLTVKTVSKTPAVSFKVTGNPDISIPGSVAQITPSFKNYSGEFTLVEEENDLFDLTQVGKTIHISILDGTEAGKYTLTLKLKLADDTVISSTAKVTVKKTALKLKLSTSKLTLNKTVNDKGEIIVTSATKGYTFSEPFWKLMDESEKNSAKGKLDISWNNGKLTVASNKATEHGATYKLLVRAGEEHPAQTLTVTVLAQNKSSVTSALKARGSIDVIRDGGVITVTPNYKNSNAQTKKTERLAFYKVVGKTLEPADDLFAYEPNGIGGFTVTKAEGANLDHSAKYQVELITVFGETYEVKSKAISLSVKQGSAKVTLTAGDTVLFSEDVHDRIIFRIDTADTALNGIEKVEIKDAKYKGLLEVIDYDNGEFAIGFAGGKVDKGLVGKTITVKFNIFIEGNETAKANTTAKLKLTVLK